MYIEPETRNSLMEILADLRIHMQASETKIAKMIHSVDRILAASDRIIQVCSRKSSYESPEIPIKAPSASALAKSIDIVSDVHDEKLPVFESQNVAEDMDFPTEKERYDVAIGVPRNKWVSNFHAQILFDKMPRRDLIANVAERVAVCSTYRARLSTDHVLDLRNGCHYTSIMRKRVYTSGLLDFAALIALSKLSVANSGAVKVPLSAIMCFDPGILYQAQQGCEGLALANSQTILDTKVGYLNKKGLTGVVMGMKWLGLDAVGPSPARMFLPVTMKLCEHLTADPGLTISGCGGHLGNVHVGPYSKHTPIGVIHLDNVVVVLQCLWAALQITALVEKHPLFDGVDSYLWSAFGYFYCLAHRGPINWSTTVGVNNSPMSAMVPISQRFSQSISYGDMNVGNSIPFAAVFQSVTCDMLPFKSGFLQGPEKNVGLFYLAGEWLALFLSLSQGILFVADENSLVNVIEFNFLVQQSQTLIHQEDYLSELNPKFWHRSSCLCSTCQGSFSAGHRNRVDPLSTYVTDDVRMPCVEVMKAFNSLELLNHNVCSSVSETKYNEGFVRRINARTFKINLCATWCYETWHCISAQHILGYSVLLEKWCGRVVSNYVKLAIFLWWMKSEHNTMGGCRALSAGCIVHGEVGGFVVTSTLGSKVQLHMHGIYYSTQPSLPKNSYNNRLNGPMGNGPCATSCKQSIFVSDGHYQVHLLLMLFTKRCCLTWCKLHYPTYLVSSAITPTCNPILRTLFGHLKYLPGLKGLPLAAFLWLIAWVKCLLGSLFHRSRGQYAQRKVCADNETETKLLPGVFQCGLLLVSGGELMDFIWRIAWPATTQ